MIENSNLEFNILAPRLFEVVTQTVTVNANRICEFVS